MRAWPAGATTRGGTPPPHAPPRWLAAELAAVNRAATPWLVVGSHRPMYVDAVDSGDQGVAQKMADSIERLLVEFEVKTWRPLRDCSKRTCFRGPGGRLACSKLPATMSPTPPSHTHRHPVPTPMHTHPAAQVDAVWTGHIHAYQRSCEGGVIKGTCLPKAPDNTSLAPVHIMTGNAGFQAPLITFDAPPAWLTASTFAYGFTEVVATRTALSFKARARAGAWRGRGWQSARAPAPAHSPQL